MFFLMQSLDFVHRMIIERREVFACAICVEGRNAIKQSFKEGF